MGMIYKQLLMGKKKRDDDLGYVWIAAHFPKRISKDFVQQTNITSSVDKILVDQLPVVTYRILGFLLLGVARIYSKKVEYLLIDCNHSLNEMKHVSEGRRKVDINFGGMCLPESSTHRSKSSIVVDVPVAAESSSKKKCNSFVEAMRAQFSSISLPENFELDAFDLEIMEDDSSNDHVKPHLELVLNDAWENDRTRHHTFGMDRWDLPTRFSDHASASTSTMITNINPETSAEKFRHRFSLDECMDPMVLSETDEEEIDLAVIPFIEQGPEPNNINSSDMIFQNRENPENDNHPDEECITGQTVVSEMTSADNIIMVKPSPDKSQLSVTINVTPQSKAPVVSSEHKSDFVAVRTPASKEHVRTPRKRKCVYDDPIVIPNKEYKEWLLNTSDLVRKRKRGRTALLASKEQQSFDCFTQPIIPSFPLDIRSVISKNNLVLIEEEEQQEVEQTMERDSKVDDLVPLDVHEVHEERDEGIAPSTPVTQATSLRFNEIHETSKVNQAGPASSYESGEKEHSPIKDVGLNENQMEEGPSSLGEVNQENVLAAEKWSAVTKRIGGYLHSNFVHTEEKGEVEAVKLTEILKQKTKKESARFFYQILVLKTGGYIDVKQEKPYGEICVIQSPKLKEVFGAGGGKERDNSNPTQPKGVFVQKMIQENSYSP